MYSRTDQPASQRCRCQSASHTKIHASILAAPLTRMLPAFIQVNVHWSSPYLAPRVPSREARPPLARAGSLPGPEGRPATTGSTVGRPARMPKIRSLPTAAEPSQPTQAERSAHTAHDARARNARSASRLASARLTYTRTRSAIIPLSASLSLSPSLTLSHSLLPARQGIRDSPQSSLRSRRRLNALCLPCPDCHSRSTLPTRRSPTSTLRW